MPNHLLRIALSPNFGSGSQSRPFIAFSDDLQKGVLKFFNYSPETSNEKANKQLTREEPHEQITVGSSSSAAHISPESRSKEEIVVNEECTIKNVKFNLSGSLLAVIESQSSLIRILSVPDGLKVCTLELSNDKGKILDVNFCSSTNFCLVMYEL